MNASAIVFGGDGQIGRALIALASSRGLDFRGCSHADADITNETAVKNAFRQFRPALAVNCAAYTAVDRAEREPDLANAVNADGAEIVAAACASMGVPLIHLSTDYVFDGSKKDAYSEFDVPAPINVYGHSKLEGEKRVRAASRSHVILRTSWVFSAHGNNFLKTIIRLACERDELRIVSDQHGCPTAAADAAEAILAAGGKLLGQNEIAGTYHFSGTGSASWHEFAQEIVKRQSAFTGRMPKVVPITTGEYPTAARRPANSALNSEPFSMAFGYTAKPWRERTAETVASLFAPANPSKAAS